jgi:glycerophosphoryl diester phosphodiesterase
MKFPALASALPLAIAHRGGAWEGPENSELAFQHAVDLGFTYIETDIRATADGIAVVFHDASLDGATTGSGRVRDLPHTVVAEARIHGRSEIMTLEQMLETFPGIRFNIDIKEPNAILPFIDVMRRTKAWDRVVVASFGHDRLRRVRRLAGPRLATSMSPREILGLWRNRNDPGNWRSPLAACVQVPLRVGNVTLVDPVFIRAVHTLGLQVHIWTVDDADEMHDLLDLGVDGIMTDRPTVLRDVLISRGQWAGPK